MRNRNYRIHATKSWASVKAELAHCFDLWEVTDWEVLSNVMESRAGNRNLSDVDRAVSVRYVYDGRTITLTLDRQERPVDNLRALFLTIDAMRLIDARGLGDVTGSAYLQLAGPDAGAARDPYEVLGVRPDSPIEVVEAAWRELSKTAHPDKPTGSLERMQEINVARTRIRTERGLE